MPHFLHKARDVNEYFLEFLRFDKDKEEYSKIYENDEGFKGILMHENRKKRWVGLSCWRWTLISSLLTCKFM